MSYSPVPPPTNYDKIYLEIKRLMSLSDFSPLTKEEHSQFLKDYRSMSRDPEIVKLVIDALCEKYPKVFLDIMDSFHSVKDLERLFNRDKTQDLIDEMRERFDTTQMKNKIPMIKYYREQTGAGLAEAKKFVEKHFELDCPW